jgi:O-antigen/teichoic acid export membrane protein
MTPGLPERFASGTIWTGAGFLVFASSGVVANVIIGATYGAAALGVFSLVFSVYTISSQVSVLGVHNSVVRHIAGRDDGGSALPTILASALILTFFLGVSAAILNYLIADAYAAATGSTSVALGLRIVAPAIALFSLNKVLLAALNGQRRMRAFALGQMLRSVALVGTVATISAQGRPSATLPAAFVVAESLLLVVLCVPRVPDIRRIDVRSLKPWMRRHASFGSRGFLGGFMVEANTRIDILMLGFLTDDTTVGIYSFASMFAIGLHSLMLVVKQNVNPVLSREWSLGHRAEIHQFVRTIRRYTYGGTVVLALATMAIFPFLASVMGEDASRDSAYMLAILLSGIALASGHLPFDGILIQAGRPGAHTILTAVGAITNASLNLALIPMLGGFGAALATSVAVCLSMLYLETATRVTLDFRLAGS